MGGLAVARAALHLRTGERGHMGNAHHGTADCGVNRLGVHDEPGFPFDHGAHLVAWTPLILGVLPERGPNTSTTLSRNDARILGVSDATIHCQ